MQKRIILIGYNFYPEPTGIGKYSGEMMFWLAQNGHDCSVITAYPYYPHWAIQEPYFNNRFWYSTEKKTFDSDGQLTVHRGPMYVPAKPTGLKRMVLDLSFLVSAFLKLLQLLPGKKYDCVIVVAPSFQFGLLGVLYRKLRNSKLIYHIQDMQIEAARDLGLIKSSAVLKLLFRVEKFIFKNSDVISSISTGMALRIQAKAEKEVLLFPNWTNITQFYPIPDKAALKSEFGFQAHEKIVLYSGAIGEKQGLEAIVHAAKELEGFRELTFVICGSGPYRHNLQELVSALGVQNVVFFPLQPFDKFNHFLNVADVHLVIQKANASDLVMPSKLTTILATGGLALITADEGSGLHSLVQEHNMGLLIKAENQQALNEGIKQAVFYTNPAITENARRYAEQNLSIDSVMREFQNAVGL